MSITIENTQYFIKVLLLFILIVLSKSCDPIKETAKVEDFEKPILLLISIDGFAYDYSYQAETPTLDSLVRVGAKATALTPVFPSKTFPNHYTQVTGLYADDHGIVSNRMYDPAFKEFFTIGSESPTASEGKWYGGEPIWVTAKKQGLTTACMFWPASDAKIKDTRPDYYFPYNGAVKLEDRIEQVVAWMQMPTNRPHFITLYFEQVDHAGHSKGPHSQAVTSAVEQIDSYLAQLMNSILNLELEQKVNLIIVSDHGMVDTSRKQVIFLDDYIDLATVEVVNWTPVLEIIPKQGTEEHVYQQLNNAHEHLKVYRKGKTPDHWHFNHHSRVTPIVALADLGWSVTSHEYFESHKSAFQGGTHGYDPSEPAMSGIFVATGPLVRPGTRLGNVESIHLYELMCFLLEIDPSENRGSLDEWTEIIQ